MPAKYTPEQRVAAFWSKVDKSGGDDACWIWAAGRLSDGYGRMGWDGRHQLAHRISFQLANGYISDELYVLHKCDNPTCVNPTHLYLGTSQDNARDREARKRRHVGRELHPRHKLTQVDVDRAIYFRDQYNLPYSYIGRILNISRQMVGHIIRGENWTAA